MNQLKVSQQETIVTLWKRGWSARRIAREMGYDRDTVGKYVGLEASKPATPTPGSEMENGAPATPTASGLESKPATLTAGSTAGVEPEPATLILGKSVTPNPSDAGAPGDGSELFAQALAAAQANVSLCAGWKKEIEAGLDQGLSAKRIHQDLVRERGFAGSYQSVKRFVRRLELEAPVPFRRMEFAPGEQLQVDFGTGAWIIDESGKRRRSHVFRAVLCCSRKGYSEATFDQKTESFLRCLENAFRHFGGVPVGTAPDNLKAAVLHPDWYDPELNPKLASFAAHYGTVVLPTKPRLPRHKGRVERGVDFVQEALRGRTFASLAEENTFLAEWERNVADTRIHGTTRRHVGQHFLEVEKPALQPLPANIFPSFTEGKRGVHLDGHVEFDRAYYSVPPEYTGREVWVRGESRVIRIYTLKMELITVHVRTEPGLSRTEDAHIHPLKRRLADRGTVYLLERCQSFGPNVGAWAMAMHRHRGIEAIRVLQGLIALTRKTPVAALEAAAAKALQRAGWKLGDLKQALTEPANVVQVDFLETHPLIREMEAYRIPFPHE
jgi:transposase